MSGEKRAGTNRRRLVRAYLGALAIAQHDRAVDPKERVDSVARQCGVSADTARRNLERLRSIGLAQRCMVGAYWLAPAARSALQREDLYNIDAGDAISAYLAGHSDPSAFVRRRPGLWRVQ